MAPFLPELGSKQTIDPSAMQEVLARGLSPRQRRLNRYWAYFGTCQDDDKEYDWDSRRVETSNDVARERAGSRLPPGLYSPDNPAPYDKRRPRVRYSIARRIVKRFTGMLFGEEHHPQVVVLSTRQSGEYTTALLESASFWSCMSTARDYGGAQGTGVVTFGFDGGRLTLEAHDPRWCLPEFKNRDTKELRSLEIKYAYPVEVRDTESGLHRIELYWYRRIIDENSDVVFKPVQVTPDPKPPRWEVERAVYHNLGQFPGQWVQNEESDTVDGHPDLSDNSRDIIDEMNQTATATSIGVKRNVDPTLIVKSAKDFKTLKKGSGSALKLGAGEDASYLTLPPGAVEVGRTTWQWQRDMVLENEAVVLELAEEVGATATEVRRRSESMRVRLGDFRRQWGERGVIPLVKKILRAVRVLESRVNVDPATGRRWRDKVLVPPKVVNLEDGTERIEERVFDAPDPENLHVTLKWPPASTPTPVDIGQALTNATVMRSSGTVDRRTATEYVAQNIGQDPDDLWRRVKDEADPVAVNMQAKTAPVDQTVVAPVSEDAPAADEIDLDEEVQAIVSRAVLDPKTGTVTLSPEDFVALTVRR